MDMATAENHRNRLQKELDAMSTDAAAFSKATKLVAMEVDRLNQQIASVVSLKSLADGSEVEIAVENGLMMVQLSMEFGLKFANIASLENFQTELSTELTVIKGFHQPLPLTHWLTVRVMQLLQQEISKQIRNFPNQGPSSPTRLYQEELEKSIKNAINTVIERDKEGATSDQVLDILRENNSLVMDDYTRNTACKRFFEATFALDSKPAPEE